MTKTKPRTPTRLHARGALLATLLLAAPALAEDAVLKIRLADVVSMPEAKGKIDGTVTFHLHGSRKAPSGTVLGDAVANKKTNAFGKSKEFACKWAALSALISLQAGAKKAGATAVVDVVSYFRKVETRDPVTFDCHVGGLMAGVALKGRYVGPEAAAPSK